ncbi:hypothetical protein D3C72_1351670 [compost metagenome]
MALPMRLGTCSCQEKSAKRTSSRSPAGNVETATSQMRIMASWPNSAEGEATRWVECSPITRGKSA